MIAAADAALPASSLDHIIGCLELDPAAVGMVRLARHRHLAGRQQALHTLAETCGVGHLLEGLPPCAIARIARAPVFGALLATEPQGSADAAALLREWIEAETWLLVPRTPTSGEHWTALGDYRLDGMAIRFAAPRLHGLVIDGRSPYARTAPLLPPEFRERIRATADLARATQKLRRALRLIDRVEPAGAELVLGALHVLVLYDDSRSGFSSSSSRHQTGVAALANTAGDDASIPMLADALLHEAMHSALYLAEADTPLFAAADTSFPRLRSPWTGAELPLHGFVHACCIWYELARFWRQALALSGAGEREPARRLLRRARQGFAGASLAEAIGIVHDFITPAARRLLRLLRARAQDLCPAGDRA